jgi:hypothetical protein
MIAQVIDKVRRPLVLSLVDGGFAFLQYAAFCAAIGAAHATSKQS